MTLHKNTKKNSMFGGLFSGISKYFTRKVKSPSVNVDSRKYSPQVKASPAESPDFSNPLFDKEDSYDEEKEESIIVNTNPQKYLLNIVVSHQSRILCFFNSFFDTTKFTHRFKNNAILCITLDEDEYYNNIIKMTIHMIYSGELTKENKDYRKANKPYYVETEEDAKMENIEYNENVPNNSTVVKFYKFPTTTISLEKNVYKDYTVPCKMYLIRHGEALHNVATPSTITKVRSYSNRSKFGYTYNSARITGYDTCLTQSGIRQAIRAGNVLYEHIEANKQFFINKYYYAYASDLLRTQQTLLLILYKVNQISFLQKYIKFILPCSHEISVKQGECDRAVIKTAVSGENKSLINPEELKNNGWIVSYYLPFQRSEGGIKTESCKSTDMLHQFLKIAVERPIYDTEFIPTKKIINDEPLFNIPLRQIYINEKDNPLIKSDSEAQGKKKTRKRRRK